MGITSFLAMMFGFIIGLVILLAMAFIMHRMNESRKARRTINKIKERYAQKVNENG